MKVFENSNIVIELDECLQCVIQNWRGFAPSEKFREGIQQTIDLFREKELNKILSNTMDFGIVKKEDTNWVNAYSMPLLIESGLRFVAFVISENIFPQMSVENFRRGATEIVEIQYFDTPEKAKQWLAEVSENNKET